MEMDKEIKLVIIPVDMKTSTLVEKEGAKIRGQEARLIN